MSERDNTLSGSEPGERKPTIVGGNGVKKPTIISAVSANSAATAPSQMPTAIQRQAPTSIKPEPVPSGTEVKGQKPTTISSQSAMQGEAPKAEPQIAAKPSVINTQNIPPLKPLVIKKPSAINGVVRKGVEVTKDELADHFPGTPEETLLRARDILSGKVIELLSESRCMQWGVDRQEQYGKMVDESLKFSSNKVVLDGSRHVGRLLVLLREVANAFQEQGSSFAFWKKRETPWEKFQEVRSEIDQLNSMLRQSLPAMLEIQERLDAIVGEFQKLKSELDAESISARYLADQLTVQPDKQGVVQRLLDRSLSLAQTVVNIQQGDIMRQSSIQEIGRLISRIQDVALVKLPAWIEQISMAQVKTLTDTDMYMFREGLEDVVQKLG